MTGKVGLRNIPTVLTNFIGRRRELSEVVQLLATSPLVTLTGVAGCGKTRLALRVAEEVGGRYADGVYWVELARLADPALVAQTVAKTLRVPEQAERTALEGLVEALQGRKLLLVLDNCEHLLSACRELCERLLAETPASVLATSRESLGVSGEKRYPVAPLATPPASLPPDDVDGIGQYDAVKLFVNRARAVVPAFKLTADNAGVIAAICRELDGIPLAIELASARVNVLTVEQIAARLDNHFELLSAAAHVTHSYHETLRAAIAWSYDLLSAQEQLLLRRLSVFAGGCSLKTAESVCAGEGIEEEQVLELISSLVNKSLVAAETLQRSEARYSLLGTIRQYGREKLKEANEWSRIQDRHLRCFLRLSEEIEPKLRGPYQKLWLNWVEDEYANIRSALSWSLDSNQVEEGLRLAIALYQFWTIRDYVEEGLNWLERLLNEKEKGIKLVVRATALCYAVLMAEFRGKSGSQKKYGREAAALADAVGDGDKGALGWALATQAFMARKAGEHQTAYALARRQIQVLRELGDTYQLGLALSIWSFAAMSLGKYDEARTMLEEGLPLLRQIGNPYRIAMALNFSGDLARCEQDYQRAQVAYEESISLLREIDAVRDLASALHNLGHACLRLGDVERAMDLFNESMALHQEQENGPGMAECLLGFAALAVVSDLPAAGARLLAAAAALRGPHMISEWAATGLAYKHYLGRARSSLSESAFRSEQAAGRALSLEEAVADAQNVAQTIATAQETRRKAGELTPREREVAALIARAKSNGEIAEELVVSKRTVETHVSNIRGKLGFDKRAQIVRWALESGLAQQPADTSPH